MLRVVGRRSSPIGSHVLLDDTGSCRGAARELPHKSPDKLSGVLSADCAVTRKLATFHLWSISVFSDPSFNAYVSATKPEAASRESPKEKPKEGL